MKYEELKNQAIVLIYPDGEVEAIPITKHQNHLPYLKEHLLDSKRFLKIAYIINYGYADHYSVSKLLSQNGVIEIANKDMCLKIKYPKEYEYYSPEFMYYLPEVLGSKEQLEILENFYDLVNQEKKSLNVYQNKMFDFLEKTEKEYQEWIAENQNRLGSEIHKL